MGSIDSGRRIRVVRSFRGVGPGVRPAVGRAIVHMTKLDENAIIDLGKTPVPGSQPCGREVEDDPDYIFVEVEIAKIDRIESDDPDWYSIVRSATNLLKSKTKDVDIASALGIALYKIHGYTGLAAWMGLTIELVRNFWDGLLPRRPRRRKATIESVPDKFGEGGWFTENPPKGDEDFNALDTCARRIAEIEALLTEKLPDDAPDFKKFLRKLTDQRARRSRPATAAPAGGAPATGGGGLAAGEINDARGAVTVVTNAAAFLRKADASDPLPYAFLRAIKWSKIELPTSDAGKYQIDPPEASRVETLQHQHGKQLWDNLLKNAEAAFRVDDPLWLDLQRYVCAALRGLGASHQRAYDAVLTGTAGLLRRLGSGLFDLKFKTGQPLCDGETRMWLEAECAGSGGGGGGESSSAGDANGKLTAARDKARKFVASGKLKEGLVELQLGLAGATQGRDRFIWRLQIAQLCFDAQRLQLASPLLEGCHEEVRRHGIDEWEPTLAVRVAETLYRCRKSLVSAEKSPNPASLEKLRDSFAWLCQLDPVAALSAEPSAK